MSSDIPQRIHHLRPLPEPSAEARQDGQFLGGTEATVTRAIVGLLRRRTGRGPPRARTALSPDLAVVTLGECMNTSERALAREGQVALAAQFRLALLDGMRAEAVAVVETITGREVAAYLTAFDHESDLATLAFHFQPSIGSQPDG
jgi:uncharacterized protein YbcI